MMKSDGEPKIGGKFPRLTDGKAQRFVRCLKRGSFGAAKGQRLVLDESLDHGGERLAFRLQFDDDTDVMEETREKRLVRRDVRASTEHLRRHGDRD